MLAWSYITILFKRVLVNCIIKAFSATKHILILMLVFNVKRFKESMNILLLTRWLIRRSRLLLRSLGWNRTRSLHILHQVVKKVILTIIFLRLIGSSFVVTGIKLWFKGWHVRLSFFLDFSFLFRTVFH